MTIILRYFIIFLFLKFGFLFDQTEEILRESKSQSELLELFFTTQDTIRSIEIAKKYIVLAKQKKDTSMLSDGYSMIASKYTNELVVKYADSIIALNKNNPNGIYPANGFLLKGYHYFDQKRLKLATDNFLEANKLALRFQNNIILFDSNYMIGLLKDRIGYFQEALEIYKRNLKFARNTQSKDGLEYPLVPVYHGIAFSFRNLKRYDSALYYNNKGLERMAIEQDSSQYSYLLLNDGIINYHLKNYPISEKSISKALEHFLNKKDAPNIAEGYYYLANIYNSNNNSKKAIHYLKKMDTVFLETKDLLPELRDGYEMLIRYYKGENNTSAQLLYLERLIKLDSTLSSNHKYVSDNLKQEYDIPNLLVRKEKLIENLQKEKSSLKFYVIVSLLIIVLLVIFHTLKRKRDKRNFDLVIEKVSKNKQEPSIDKKDNTQYKNTQNIIPDDILKSIIENLEEFELNTDFLDKKITLNSLAKRFSTNSSYLSKTINSQYNKNFANYLSELRINYTLKKLKEDKVFRKYAIKTIAYESGFNSAETFSKSFKKIAGIYPSFYIKQIDKLNNGK